MDVSSTAVWTARSCLDGDAACLGGDAARDPLYSSHPSFATPTFAQAPDRLRIEERDGYLHELRLEPVGVLRLGRAERVGEERNELV
ncbi:hypothetical protein [Sorangium sp. So ce1182]|uniref:hypothetical protein n=1 Tax=Sorangium sp. So ce1182 TaxID=3133334 RepID=UPI003F62F0B3